MAEQPKEERPTAPDESDELEAELNRSLGDVLDLLASQVEYLKESLEFLRLSSDVEERDAKIRWHVQQIDLRQDRMEEIKVMILAGDGSEEH